MFRRFPLHRQMISWTALGFLAFCGPLLGQQPQPAGGAPREPRPEPPQAEVQVQIPADLIPILQTWEQKSAALERVTAEFRRFEYDSIFRIEKRAQGTYWFESPDKGRMDFKPADEIPDPPQNRVNGAVYSVQPDSAKSWICTGKEILDIDIANKTYNRMQIPLQFQGERITDGPLPFLFGMKAAKVQEKYRLSLGNMHNPQEALHIVAYPLAPNLRREFQRAEILLNPHTYAPTAVKLWDPSGNKETVYVFSPPKKIGPFAGTPWNVRLTGYKLMEDFKAQPEEGPGGGAQDPGEGPFKRDATRPGILVK